MNTSLTLSIPKMVWLLDEHADAILSARLGVDFATAKVLMILHRDQPCSQRFLASRLGQTPAAVTKSLPAFVEQGFVQVRIDPTQPRRNLLELTPKGSELAGSCRDILERAFEDLLIETKIDLSEFSRQINLVCQALACKPIPAKGGVR